MQINAHSRVYHDNPTPIYRFLAMYYLTVVYLSTDGQHVCITCSLAKLSYHRRVHTVTRLAVLERKATGKNICYLTSLDTVYSDACL